MGFFDTSFFFIRPTECCLHPWSPADVCHPSGQTGASWLPGPGPQHIFLGLFYLPGPLLEVKQVKLVCSSLFLLVLCLNSPSSFFLLLFPSLPFAIFLYFFATDFLDPWVVCVLTMSGSTSPFPLIKIHLLVADPSHYTFVQPHSVYNTESEL